MIREDIGERILLCGLSIIPVSAARTRLAQAFLDYLLETQKNGV